MFLEIKRYRWVENQKEARRLLAQAVEEAPQVGAVIDAMGAVIATLELNMNNSRLPVNSNDTPPAQNNSRDNDDNSDAGAAAAVGFSAVRMHDSPNKKVDISSKSEQKDSKVSPKKDSGFSSLLTPKKSPHKDDSQKFKTPAQPKEMPAEDQVTRTPQQEDIKKALHIRDHTKNWCPRQKQSELDATQVPFSVGSPRASSTYVEQGRPDSPSTRSLQSPRSPMSQILYRTVRMQGILFNFGF